MKIEVPIRVREIIETLQEQGYDAYAVGGCVRDSLLHSSPADWDITTSAKPAEVKKLFKRTIDTGIEHGTVTIMFGKEGFEVTTYRIDGEYEDSRHPKEVTFTADLKEDLRRRDFTINAMAYNDREGLIDIFGGREDLEAGVIRCVGNPYERFTEDALRILRAMRFAAKLGFRIDPHTRQAAEELAPTLKKISAERIAAELIKLLTSAHPDFLKLAWESGITAVILPEFDCMMDTPQNTPHHAYNVGEHTLKALKYVEADKVLRMTILMHDMGKPATRKTDVAGRDHFISHNVESEKIARTILRRLKLDNDLIRKVTKLVYWHDYRPMPDEKAVRKAASRIGTDLFPLLLKVQYADIMAQSTYRQEEKLDRLQKVEEIYKGILERKECMSVKELAVNGKDLIEAGIKPGPRMGEILENLLQLVLQEPEKNEKNALLQEIRKYL